MTDCIFCKIIAGEIPSDKVYEDEFVYAFRDIAPQAKVHVLVLPKAHVANIHESMTLPDNVLAALWRAVDAIAAQLGLVREGYRVVVNSGENAGQTVPHLHLHVLGGETLSLTMA